MSRRPSFTFHPACCNRLPFYALDETERKAVNWSFGLLFFQVTNWLPDHLSKYRPLSYYSSGNGSFFSDWNLLSSFAALLPPAWEHQGREKWEKVEAQQSKKISGPDSSNNFTWQNAESHLILLQPKSALPQWGDRNLVLASEKKWEGKEGPDRDWDTDYHFQFFFGFSTVLLAHDIHDFLRRAYAPGGLGSKHPPYAFAPGTEYPGRVQDIEEWGEEKSLDGAKVIDRVKSRLERYWSEDEFRRSINAAAGQGRTAEHLFKIEIFFDKDGQVGPAHQGYEFPPFPDFHFFMTFFEVSYGDEEVAKALLDGIPDRFSSAGGMTLSSALLNFVNNLFVLTCEDLSEGARREPSENRQKRVPSTLRSIFWNCTEYAAPLHWGVSGFLGSVLEFDYDTLFGTENVPNVDFPILEKSQNHMVKIKYTTDGYRTHPLGGFLIGGIYVPYKMP